MRQDILSWRLGYERGALPLDRLREASQQLAAQPKICISRISESTLKAQTQVLLQYRQSCEDWRQLWRRYPLWGIPFCVKDNIDVNDLPTTAACAAFAYAPERSADVVTRLTDAGAVVIGKTNLDQFATGLVGTRSPYGAPSAIWSQDHVSGGSSSGSALAVALGAVPFALGTDTAGSGRVPAAFNGLVGMKPTFERISTQGVVPACESFDCVSLFSHTADDAALLLRCVEQTPGDWDVRPLLRIGIPAQLDPTVDIPTHAHYQQTLDELSELGHAIVPLDFEPLHTVGRSLYNGPWVRERLVASAAILESDPDSLDPTVCQILQGAQDIDPVSLIAARADLELARRAMEERWDLVDALLVPTTPTQPTLDEVAADPINVNAQLGVYTNFVNLLGCAAIAFPIGITNEQRRIGATLIGPAHSDASLLDQVARWQASRRPLAISSEQIRVVVVGAHLSGMPLNHQLTDLQAQLVQATTTAPNYRLYALPDTTPPKPALIRCGSNGYPIIVEEWSMPISNIGQFLAQIPSPLGLGRIELADGRLVHGFLAETIATENAEDISTFGGWRAYCANRSA